jgi:hypothetical protein
MNASVPSANISLYIAEWGEDATMVFATFCHILGAPAGLVEPGLVLGIGAESSTSNSSSVNMKLGRWLGLFR